MKYLLILLTLLAYIGCTHNEVNNNEFSKRDGNPALNSLFQQFYLSPPPEWLHYSFEGECFIKKSVSYLNYEKLQQSLAFDYRDAVMAQRMLNRSISEKTLDSKLGEVLLVDQHTILATVIERVRASNYIFPEEGIRDINVIWLDPAWNSLDEHMKKLSQNEKFYSAYPLWVSFCHTSSSIEKILNEKYPNLFTGMAIGAESFSIFNEDTQRVPYRVFNFSKFMGENRKIHLYIPESSARPKGFKGQFQNTYYY